MGDTVRDDCWVVLELAAVNYGLTWPTLYRWCQKEKIHSRLERVRGELRRVVHVASLEAYLSGEPSEEDPEK